ncbi:MAG: hypothetical protein NTW28_03650 [Candidatus Solibacter sp.]|nr:hypothetical protein [Candidatus Solibacter sp.]
MPEVRFCGQRDLELRVAHRKGPQILEQHFFGPNTTANNTLFGQVTARRNLPRHMQMTLRFQI